DTTPPTVTSAKAIDATHVEVTFSEALETNSALLTSNYALSNNLGNPIEVNTSNLPNVFLLAFQQSLTTANYTLQVTNVRDKKLNPIATNNTATFFYLQPYSSQKGDIIINEIFADPSPVIGLPASEFVELWNTTDKYISLKDWKYTDQSTVYTFGEVILEPNQLLVLCPLADVNLYKPFSKTIGLSPWPSLNNDKDILTLSNSQSEVINQISYADTWYKDSTKKLGGYTLELLDPQNKCTGIQNWKASKAALGGTPGTQNSTYLENRNTEKLMLTDYQYIDSLSVQLTFNQEIDSSSAGLPSNYNMNRDLGTPNLVQMDENNLTTVILKWKQPMRRDTHYLLSINNVSNCGAKQIEPISIPFFKAKYISPNDILISEVLFNPNIGGADFVEIYNNSNYVLDLQELQLANRDSKGALSSIKNISNKMLLMQPQTYWVMTTKPEILNRDYTVENPNQVIQMNVLPAYNIDKGNVVLLSNTALIDELNYTNQMHLALLQNTKGISLERVSFFAPTNQINNFVSAAATAKYATPTAKNSQQLDTNNSKDDVFVSYTNFSPDGDGFEDELEINYQFDRNALFASINIYNQNGVLQRKLLRNETISANGKITWDGMNDRGQKCNIGIYIVITNVFDLTGYTKKYSKAVALVTKFN
ncbi:MAG: lamin tail domain-containing protein, partial [Sphingobacteriaceae bacterium]|nr:lamin tail domain-containing protein [Sphingobacteriaceae bacterium]